MKRREFIALSGAAALAMCLPALAQQPEKLPRIAFLGNSTAALEANLVGAFRDGLRELGYVEDRTILIEYRWAEGRYERLPSLVGELVQVIVTAGTSGRARGDEDRAVDSAGDGGGRGSDWHRARREPGADHRGHDTGTLR
jgi:putative tryptophan/tyrosine transport system substrate-binding protein